MELGSCSPVAPVGPCNAGPRSPHTPPPVTGPAPTAGVGAEKSHCAGATSTAVTRSGGGSTHGHGLVLQPGLPTTMTITEAEERAKVGPWGGNSPSAPIPGSKEPLTRQPTLQVWSTPDTHFASLHTHHRAGSPQEDFTLSCPRPCSEIWRPLRKKQIY